MDRRKWKLEGLTEKGAIQEKKKRRRGDGQDRGNEIIKEGRRKTMNK